MKQDSYNKFINDLSNEFTCVDIVKKLILDTDELSKYGEKRVALENLLENLLENKIHISSELVELAEDAFSDNPSSYDNELIGEMKKLN